MDAIATIGTLGALVLFLHLRLERRIDRLEDKLGFKVRVLADKLDIISDGTPGSGQ